MEDNKKDQSPNKAIPAIAAAIAPSLISGLLNNTSNAEGSSGPLGAISGFMENQGTALGIGLSLAQSVIGARRARKAERRARKQAKEARKELDIQKAAYEALDTSNPYLNMENTMEDLTVNQQQANFQRQQFQQSQANILQGLQGAAGGSGIAALAQSLAQQGQLASQQASASIGQQEAANQRAAASQAAQIQAQERQGELISRQQEREKTETLLGMAQQDFAAKRTAVADARQARFDAIQGGIEGAAEMFAGFDQGEAQQNPAGGAQAYYNALCPRINAQGQRIDENGNVITQ